MFNVHPTDRISNHSGGEQENIKVNLRAEEINNITPKYSYAIQSRLCYARGE